MRSASNPSVHNGYHSYVGSPAVPGASGTTFLNKMPGMPCFLAQRGKKTLLGYEQWLHSISDARNNFNDQWVRAAIN